MRQTFKPEHPAERAKAVLAEIEANLRAANAKADRIVAEIVVDVAAIAWRGAQAERRSLLVELASFDTTRFPGMEAEAVRQAEKFGLDPIDLLLACESIRKAGIEEVRAANDAENGVECRCGRGGFGCCEDT